MSESEVEQQNNDTATTHDYDDHYYLKDNPYKKTDFPILKSDKDSGEKNDSSLSQNFYNELTTQDPTLGGVLDTDVKTATLEKHDLTETPANKPVSTDFFLDEPSDMSFLEERQQLTDTTNNFLNKGDKTPITESDVAEIFDLVANNFEKPKLDKTQIPTIEIVTNQVLQNEELGSLTKAKMMYLAFDFNSLIDAQYKTESAKTLKIMIAKMIKTGSPDDISTLSELIKLASPHSNLTDQIINHIIPDIHPPLGNVDNQIEFASNCLDQSKAKLSYFEERPYFKETYTGYKKINEINHYVEKIFSTIELISDLSEGQKSSLEDLLSKDMSLYAGRLNNISDVDMDHDHIAPLFRSLLMANRMGLNFDRKLATDIFSSVYNGIYLNNGPRVGDQTLLLADFCDTFGLDSLRESILNRGIKFVSDHKVKEQINTKYHTNY